MSCTIDHNSSVRDQWFIFNNSELNFIVFNFLWQCFKSINISTVSFDCDFDMRWWLSNFQNVTFIIFYLLLINYDLDIKESWFFIILNNNLIVRTMKVIIFSLENFIQVISWFNSFVIKHLHQISCVLLLWHDES